MDAVAQSAQLADHDGPRKELPSLVLGILVLGREESTGPRRGDVVA
jgi:hypothetical protein